LIFDTTNFGYYISVCSVVKKAPAAFREKYNQLFLTGLQLLAIDGPSKVQGVGCTDLPVAFNEFIWFKMMPRN
jgi:hypothetical protein